MYFHHYFYLQYGNTALFAAAEKGHVNVVDKLIDSGADVNDVNRVSEKFILKDSTLPINHIGLLAF